MKLFFILGPILVATFTNVAEGHRHFRGRAYHWPGYREGNQDWKEDGEWVTFYTDPHFQGNSVKKWVNGHCQNLHEKHCTPGTSNCFWLHDAISSVDAYKCIRVYHHINCEGKWVDLWGSGPCNEDLDGPGCDMNDLVSSVAACPPWG